jgi:hypothetical protein
MSRPREFWIKKGTNTWKHIEYLDDENFTEVRSFSDDNYYDCISSEKTDNGTHVIEHSVYAQALDLLRECREITISLINQNAKKHSRTCLFEDEEKSDCGCAWQDERNEALVTKEKLDKFLGDRG